MVGPVGSWPGRVRGMGWAWGWGWGLDGAAPVGTGWSQLEREWYLAGKQAEADIAGRAARNLGNHGAKDAAHPKTAQGKKR